MRSVVVCTALLFASSSAFAAAQHQVKSVKAMRGGARFNIRLVPEYGYGSVTLGIAPGNVGRYGRIQKSWVSRRAVPRAMELTFELKYDGKRYKKGAEVTIISKWPGMGRTHYWGTQSFRLP